MTKYIGEITIVKTNMETGEVSEHSEFNTQLMGMLSNLAETASAPSFSTNNTSSVIYISDNNFPLTRQTYDPSTTNQTFAVGGAVISGEYWPQYSNDTVLKRATFTFKQRFAPGASTRTINTIALYAPSYAQYMAGLRLQTPCVQTTLDILDIYYKIYVYYDALSNVNDYNLNKNYLIRNSLISRWFYSSGTSIYAEGTTTNMTVSGTWFNTVSFMPVDSDLRDLAPSSSTASMETSTTPWNFYSVTPTTSIQNNSQGTTIRSYSMATTGFVGCILNKVMSSRWDYSLSTTYTNAVSATPVLAPNDSRIQSVYLKSSSSATTNFAYLDPSTIGSSTATLTLNDSGWTTKWRPSMFKINVTTGGNISTAKYTVSMRNSFGFADNFFNTERYIPLNNIMRRFTVDTQTYTSNSAATRAANIKRIDNRYFVTSAPTGITIGDAYLNNFQNFDLGSTPSLASSAIQDAVPMPDGSILIVTIDKGLLKLSADRTSITQFTGIGSGVSDNLCYAVAVKANGDFWAMFEGGLAKNVGGVWTVYNSSSPITFTASLFNPNWSNTLSLHCRTDAGGDAVAITAISTTSITWWSPSSPTAVVTTANGNMARYNSTGITRGDATNNITSLPGTNVWFFQNYNNTISRMTFGTNTATIVSAYSNTSYKAAVMHPVMYNGAWAMQSFETNTSGGGGSTVRWYNETSLVTSDTAINTYITIGSSTYMAEAMDEYGTCIVVNFNTSGGIYQCWLMNILNPLSPNSWRNYGWNSTTSQWELGNTNSKPVHTTMDNLPDGLKCSFTPTGTNDFILNERWVGYVTDGLHKDNSTTAILSTAIQARNYYTTTDLSATTVPSTALGSTTEKFSAYTLGGTATSTGINQAMSWNGGVSAAYYNSNSVANSLKSELVVSGDFTFNFWANPYAGTTSASNSTCYIGFYDNAVSATSKWAFRFTNSGYLVTEDDVTKTTNVAPTVAQKYTIKRVGSTITYLVNDVLIYTSTITNSNTLRGIFRMPSSDNTRTFYDMSLVYNENRRVLKIGSPVNQTGVYDANYAMIEAWINNPQGISITLNGVAATVLTDPAVAPAAGQVLLLQKSGMLVFNAADAGKTVACTATVLQEM